MIQNGTIERNVEQLMTKGLQETKKIHNQGVALDSLMDIKIPSILLENNSLNLQHLAHGV